MCLLWAIAGGLWGDWSGMVPADFRSGVSCVGFRFCLESASLGKVLVTERPLPGGMHLPGRNSPRLIEIEIDDQSEVSSFKTATNR